MNFCKVENFLTVAGLKCVVPLCGSRPMLGPNRLGTLSRFGDDVEIPAQTYYNNVVIA
jgi:hypothetical protein